MDVVAKSGEGWSAQRISDWLLQQHGIRASSKAVRKSMVRLAAERAPITRALAVAELGKTVSGDLAAVDAILERARADEDAALKAAEQQGDIIAELENLALADIAQAFDENGGLKPIHEIPLSVRKAISAVEVEQIGEQEGTPTDDGGERTIRAKLVKLKFWDKAKALDLLDRIRATSRARELAIKARAQQQMALQLRLEMSGATGRSGGAGARSDDLASARERLEAALELAEGRRSSRTESAPAAPLAH